MEVLSPSRKYTQALEMVSEEEVILEESEQEEGEICSDDEEEGEEMSLSSCPHVCHSAAPHYDNSVHPYPTHLPFQDRRTNKKPTSAALASEVVIYDDSGRTAIFTSPKKKRLNTYPRRGEGSRQHARDTTRRKDKEVVRGRRHHSSSAAAPEKWSKITRTKTSGTSEEVHLHSHTHTHTHGHRSKEVRSAQRTRRNRPTSPDSSSGSSSSSSCSCSSSTSSVSGSLSEEESSDVTVISPCKGRGKENRRCGPSSKGHDRSSPPREYGCDRPPPKVTTKPAGHRSSKHSGSQHRPPSPHPRETRRRPYHQNIRRSSKERDTGKTSHHHQHRTHPKPKAKASERKEATKPVKEVESVSNVAKGQNWLPRGSLGEMLLSRPKAASTTQGTAKVPGEDTKAPGKHQEEGKNEVAIATPPPPPSEAAKELPTLDQEDDEELQLRLVAIQSSLRLLTYMQKEGAGDEASGNTAGDEASGSQEMLKHLMGPHKDNAEPGSYTPPLTTRQEIAEMERTLGEVFTMQSSDIISISSSSASEFCIENLATNKSYLEAAVEGAEGGDAKETDDAKVKGKERSDVDQDPVDMEICDSSGEDEERAGMVVVVRDSPLSPEPGQDAGQASGELAAKGEGVAQLGEGVGGGNFQIPVEWAYMVPPPPPPDQPANDLENISSWCYDQNMYLQSMQVPSTEEQEQEQQQHQQQPQPEQHQQHSQPDPGEGEWPPPPPLPHPHTAPWPPPFMESYDNTHPAAIPDNTEASVPMSIPLEQHSYPPLEVPQALETPSEQSQDLKDVPAEQYQAFMSAVLQQQQSPTPKSGTTFTKCPQRNLIMVPLNGNLQSESTSAAGASPSLTTKKSKNQKTRARKRRIKQQRAQDNVQCLLNSNIEGASANASLENEEDEDLLRAQLLIDMSRKKEQRVTDCQTWAPPATATTSATLPTPLPTSVPLPLSRGSGAGREGFEGRASPHTLLQSSESLSPVPRNVRKMKNFSGRPRSGENSPTHTFRADLRPGLSDIGGWGLDPKGSKFNYHTTQHDFPHTSNNDVVKVKFPPIKPIIISLQSDTEDSEEEEEDTSRGASSVESGRKDGEAESVTNEPMSHSIDILLKSMRNANPPTKEFNPPSPKPGPSTPSPMPPKRRKEVADITPQAVRHLSRHQQEEYRWLKEQLRKKEMLQRKKMQQRPIKTKTSKPLLPPPLSRSPLSPGHTHGGQGSASPSFSEDCTRCMSPSKDTLEEAGGEGTSSSTREVTWKDMGLLQIQVSNEAALDTSTENDDSSSGGRKVPGTQAKGGYSSVSATDDEDEETLRMMALLTQKKKMESALESQHRRGIIAGRKAEESSAPSEETDTQSEGHPDEGLKGEWMVLDEVREEGTDVGEEELCIRTELSENETDDCGEGEETNDSMESFSRSPETATGEVTTETKQQDTMKDSEEEPISVNMESSGTSDAGTNNTDQAASQEPPSEDGNSNSTSTTSQESTPDTKDTKDHPAVKTDAKQTMETSSDGEKIEEVIRRIESKTRVVRKKVTNETPSTEAKKTNVSTLVSNAKPAGITKKPQGAEPLSRDEAKGTADQGVLETKQTVAPHKSTEGTNMQVKSSTTTSTTSTSLDAQAKDTTKITAEKQKVTFKRIVVMPDTSIPMKRKVNVVRSVGGVQQKVVKEVVTAPAATGVTTAMTNGTITAPQDTEKITKMQLQLKRLEKEYSEKKNGINKIIMQMGEHLAEVNEEQRQRQALKKTVGELKIKLKEMEAQLESKSSTVQTKMEVIRRLQQQLGRERQAQALLEHQGERMGILIHGTGYSLPKALPSSPNSKTKDVHMKKALASSISALRQQVRDLTNKRNSKLAAAATNSSPTGVETRVVRTLHLETKKDSATGSEKSFPQGPLVSSTPVETSQVAPRTVSQGKVPVDTSGKPQGKEGTVVVQGKVTLVKRKLVSSVGVGGGGAKVAKVQVPMQTNAIQERRVPGVPSGTSKHKADDQAVEEKLDEMKALCPHDLLGRCNDAACKYQHLPSARPSLPTTTQGHTVGMEPPAAATTIASQGRLVKGAGGKPGAKVKLVPVGGDGKGGCSVVGSTVPQGPTVHMTLAVPSELLVRQVTDTSTTSTPGSSKINAALVSETHSTQQRTETAASLPNTLTHQLTNTPTSIDTNTLTTADTNTLATHQQNRKHNHNTTETSPAHHGTETHTSTHQQNSTLDFIELTTPATPNTRDPEHVETESHTNAKDSSEEAAIESTDDERRATEPQAEVNVCGTPDREPQEGRTEPALQKEAAAETPVDITEKTTQATEPQTPDDTETQTLQEATDENMKAATDDTHSPSTTTTTTTTTTMEDELSDSESGTLRLRLRKTGSRRSRKRTSSKGSVENPSLDTSLEEQEGEDVEEGAVVDQKKARVTRKSLRVKTKVPKSTASSDGPRASPRKGRKRKSEGGESTTVKNPSGKRRNPTRTSLGH